MDWSFGIAAGAIRLGGDAELLSTLQCLFQTFPKPSAGDSVLGSLCWESNCCRIDLPGHPASTIQVLSRESRTAATTILLARVLTRARPDWTFLHGNGLLIPDSGRLVFLLGDSGAGKTTLTGQFLTEPYGWEHVAEDLLMIEPGARRLHPFPRALAHRYRAGENADAPPAESLIFGFGGDSQPRKNLTEFPSRRAPVPLPLGEAPLVALLEAAPAPAAARPSAPSPALIPRERAWLSWADGATLDSLRAAGLPAEALRIEASVAIVTYARPLTTPERALQYTMFEQMGILHLHSESVAPDGSHAAHRTASGELRRPPAPIIEALKPSEGVQRLMSFLKTPATNDTAGRLFFRMAQALAEARFVRFVPGGTPEQSAACLAEVASR